MSVTIACLSSGIKLPPPIPAGWRIPACGIFHEQSWRAKATTAALSGMLARNDNESAFSVRVCAWLCARVRACGAVPPGFVCCVQ